MGLESVGREGGICSDLILGRDPLHQQLKVYMRRSWVYGLEID